MMHEWKTWPLRLSSVNLQNHWCLRIEDRTLGVEYVYIMVIDLLIKLKPSHMDTKYGQFNTSQSNSFKTVW